jgi:hypothetical protein
MSLKHTIEEDFPPEAHEVYDIRPYVSMSGVFNSDDQQIKIGTREECIRYCIRIGLKYLINGQKDLFGQKDKTVL